jgi:DNA invertase Pin-like site-specific DNA recombinase
MNNRQDVATSPAPEKPRHVSEPLIRSVRSSKIQPRHWERSAIVYVRQSTPRQVQENLESKARQYDLANHAIALGWPTGRVVIIDEDQGKSGRDAEHRSGFQRLLAEVTLGHVGLVLGLEMSRLARSSKDWHHLLELCALFDTLLGDQDGVYNPMDSNDRLLLGLKGTMSEFELFTMRNRLQRGLLHKAERGELHIAPPLGYERLVSGEIVLDTDEQARDVIQLIFDKFDELGTARRVLIYLIQNKIQLGIRWNRGPRRGQLEWRRPQYGTILRVLTHPNYAGAYVYGRKEVRRAKQTRRTNSGELSRYRPSAWKILMKDHMPSYISWDRYEANQKRLQGNIPIATSPGVARDGVALLVGLVVCGTCGRKLHPLYPRAGKPYYYCSIHNDRIEEQICHGVTAGVIDGLVVEQVHQALKPASLALSLRAIEDGQKERARLDEHWKKKIERARYEVQRAERQYQAVEPENRLVARTLEQRWEAAMLEQRRHEEEFNRFSRDSPQRLTETERSRIVALSADIPAVWNSNTTTNGDRKDIIRCLVEQVVVIAHKNTEYCDVTIHWKGGYTSQHEVVRPVQSFRQLRDGDQLRKRITELHQQGQTAATIAATLTAEGHLSPRRRNPFSPGNIHQLVRKYNLATSRVREELPKDEWWLSDLAKKLSVTNRKLRDWALRKWCHARQLPDPGGLWIIWANQKELDRLGRLKEHSKLGTVTYPTKLTTPTKRKR